jgi:hypothetical protein
MDQRDQLLDWTVDHDNINGAPATFFDLSLLYHEFPSSSSWRLIDFTLPFFDLSTAYLTDPILTLPRVLKV